MRTWLTELRTQIKDAVSAGEDATRPTAKCEVGRRAARRLLVEARGALDQLLRAAECGLD